MEMFSIQLAFLFPTARHHFENRLLKPIQSIICKTAKSDWIRKSHVDVI